MTRIEEQLMRRGLLSETESERARETAARTHRSLQEVWVADGFVSEQDVLAVQAEQYGLPLVRLDELVLTPAAVAAVSAKLASHYGVMPVALEAGVLTLAVSNPLNLASVEDIEATLGYRVERVLACRSDILKALRQHYGVGADTVERILATSADAIQVAPLEESHDLEKQAEDASVVKLVNQLLQQAIADRATDLHFEVNRAGIAARRRIDGTLYDTPVSGNMKLLYPAIVSRVKLMAGLNIVERRLPQDGRARVTVGRQTYDLRVSIVPTLHGEDVVIRILPSAMLFNLDTLGFSERHRAMLEEQIAAPHGIVFVTGPTGSGKSTTLYACLSRLNSRDRKIITIEDPVEYELSGVTQTQIAPKIGLTFARALRSMLRHDPDIMMVGEVRDRETAEIAVQTAMTGHLVLSTLHTNDAAAAAARLIDMGIDPYLIASTVRMFIAQRLVRLVCEVCKESYETKDGRRFRGRGCRACNQSGFKGRIAIAEFLPMKEDVQSLVLRKASAPEIRRQANALGMKTLAEDGEDKAVQGLTTPEEVMRVTCL